jgi:hypothetical protein
MKRNRFWIEIIALASGIAFAVALLIATLGAALSFTGEPAVGQELPKTASQSVSVAHELPQVVTQADGSQTYEGMVTCSICGAKHSAKLGASAANCTRNCVRTGASFSLVNGDKVYELDGDLTLLKKVAGQRARVVGVMHGNRIEVSALDAA